MREKREVLSRDEDFNSIASLESFDVIDKLREEREIEKHDVDKLREHILRDYEIIYNTVWVYVEEASTIRERLENYEVKKKELEDEISQEEENFYKCNHLLRTLNDVLNTTNDLLRDLWLVQTKIGKFRDLIYEDQEEVSLVEALKLIDATFK